MKKPLFLFSILLIAALILGSCATPPEETPTPESGPVATRYESLGDHLLISEVLAGVEGNNLHDFIELFNPTIEIIDLKGYALWYQLKDEDEPTLVHFWDERDRKSVV